MSAQQQLYGDAFEHACALRLMKYYEKMHKRSLYIQTCATFERQKKVFALLQKNKQDQLLHQATLFIDGLFNMESFFLKGFFLPVSLCMLGSAHGKKGNTTDIEMHFKDAQRLNISCKHRSEENKAPRMCYDASAQSLSITSFGFCHQDEQFNEMMDGLLVWLRTHEGSWFSNDPHLKGAQKKKLYNEKWYLYSTFCQQFATTCFGALMIPSASAHHTSFQKEALREIIEFFIGTHSYFLIKKINEFEGVIQKMDTAHFCKMLQNDQVHLSNVYSYGIQKKESNPKGLHNYVCFEFSNGFAIKMRLKNGNKVIGPTALKFSVTLKNSSTLFATEHLSLSPNVNPTTAV